MVTLTAWRDIKQQDGSICALWMTGKPLPGRKGGAPQSGRPVPAYGFFQPSGGTVARFFSLFGGRKGILRRYPLSRWRCSTMPEYGQNHRRIIARGEDTACWAQQAGCRQATTPYMSGLKALVQRNRALPHAEYQRLDDLTADGTYSREPQRRGTQRLYLWRLLSAPQLFLSPTWSNSVKYSSDMEEILAQAKENVATFYQESVKCSGERQEMPTILNHYSGPNDPRVLSCMTVGEALLSMTFPIC